MKRTKALNRAFPGDMSIVVVLAGVLGVLGMVVLVVKISDDPGAQKRLPEEARLADFAVLPPPGPWLGIDISPNDRMLETMPNGVVISRVMMNSPAQRAGLRAGDVLERVGNTTVRMPGDIRKSISGHKVGDTIRLTINRNGRQRALNAKLGLPPMGRLAAAVGPAGGAWLGLDVQGINNLMAKQLGLPDTRGVIVAHVYPGSPAALAGLAQGDVIRRIGETRLRDIDQLFKLVAAQMPGNTVRLTVLHKGAIKDVPVMLSTLPPPSKQPKPTLPEAEVEIEAAWLGLDIVPLSPAEAEEFGIPDNVRGMIVDAVAPGQGVDVGFQPGDVIIAINGKPTPTVKTFKDATERAPGAVVDVIRFGHHIYLSVPPPNGMTGQPNMRLVRFRAW